MSGERVPAAEELNLLRAWLAYRLWQRCRGDDDRIRQAEFVRLHRRPNGRAMISKSLVSEIVGRRKRLGKAKPRAMGEKTWTSLLDIFSISIDAAVAEARIWRHSSKGKQWLAGGEPKADDLPPPSKTLAEALDELALDGVPVGDHAKEHALWRLVDGDKSKDEWKTLLIRYQNMRRGDSPRPRPISKPRGHGKLAEITRHNKHSSAPPPAMDAELSYPPAAPDSRRSKKER